MTPQHGYPQGGGGAAGRGIVLVVVAIALGAFLLARGFDGSDDGSAGAASSGAVSDGGSSGSSGDDSEGDDGSEDPASTTTSTTTTTTTTTAPPPTTHPPGQVKVAAVNGKGAPGLAGAVAEKLITEGFTTVAKNAVNFGMETSVIYYQPGYAEDAKVIAGALNAPGNILNELPSAETVLELIRDPSDVSDFHVFVLLAADDAVPVVV